MKTLYLCFTFVSVLLNYNKFDMRKLQSRPIDTIGIRYKTVESQKEYFS